MATSRSVQNVIWGLFLEAHFSPKPCMVIFWGASTLHVLCGTKMQEHLISGSRALRVIHSVHVDVHLPNESLCQ